MAAEKNFENKVKTWLESEGIYPLGTGADKMPVPPCGYYEKRWGGGYSKSGLPDLHIVVNGINVDVEVKSSIGKPSELQKHNVKQINYSWSMAFILYPEGFDSFKEIMKGLIECDGHIPKLNVLKSVHSNSKCDTLMNLK
jgi:hypothetical protein